MANPSLQGTRRKRQGKSPSFVRRRTASLPRRMPMSAAPTLPPEAVLRGYFHAKDENRPHLLDRVFTRDAVLEVRNATSTIAFPAITSGREEIADVLVRVFGQTYENVYSFYLQRPGSRVSSFECDWLVAMTEKTTRNARVGCGSYEWTFDPKPPHLASRLVITIAAMQILPPAAALALMSGVEQLTYPWSSRAELERVAPKHTPFEPLLQYLSKR